MPLIIEIGGAQLTYTDDGWTADEPRDSEMAATANQLMDEPPGVSGADPYPALTNAKRIVQALGGKIIDEGQPPAFDPDVVY
jgi:hypothetical protein